MTDQELIDKLIISDTDLQAVISALLNIKVAVSKQNLFKENSSSIHRAASSGH